MEMPRLTLRLLPAAALLLSASLARAQSSEGSHWNTIPLDSLISNVQTRGTILTVQQPTQVLLYSAILRRWTVLPVSSTAIVNNHNEHVVVEDGTTIHAWASHRGTVETISLGATGILVEDRSKLAIVQDGATVHGFSAWTGQWATLVTQSATPTIAASGDCAVVHDGVDAFGFSAYHGTWVSTPVADPLATVTADGHVGMVNSPTLFRGFAADANTWNTKAFGSTAGPSTDIGYAYLIEGNTITAFSGYRGSFSEFTASSAGFVVQGDDNTIAITDGDDVTCYSAVQGTFQTTTLTAPQALVDKNVVVVSSAASFEIVGFSGMTGRFTAPIPAPLPHTITVDSSIALVTFLGLTALAYSPIHDEWVQAPAPSFSAETVLEDGVVLTTPGGFTAFGIREASWSNLSTSGAATLKPPSPRGSTALVEDGGELHAWDPRLGRWATATVGALNQSKAAFALALAEDGNTGYGFGLYSNVWDTVQLQEAGVGFKTSSQIAYLQTANYLHVFTPHGTLSARTNQPETTNGSFLLTGSSLDLLQVAPAQSIVMSFLAFAPGFTPISGGILFLSGGLTPFALPPVPGDGKLEFSFAIPSIPSFAGLIIHFQDAVVPPSGLVYLTNSISPVIL